MIKLLYKLRFSMSLDFSNLSKAITIQGEKNYKINTKNPIDGYFTKNAKSNTNMHSVIMIH